MHRSTPAVKRPAREVICDYLVGDNEYLSTCEAIAENHWALFAWIADNVFIPAMPVWVVVFGAVQLAVGVLLVVGYRTREASILGLAYLGGLNVMGMTRYAPFAFGLLVVVLALDGGRTMSLDAARAHRKTVRARYGLPIPPRAIPALIALAAINAVAATATAFNAGITPDGYTGSMGAVTTAMVAIFSGLLAWAGWIQHEPPVDVASLRRAEELAASQRAS